MLRKFLKYWKHNNRYYSTYYWMLSRKIKTLLFFLLQMNEIHTLYYIILYKTRLPIQISKLCATTLAKLKTL